MADDQLVNWIKDNQSKGYSLDQLKDVLINQGHSEQEVNNAISLVSISQQPSSIPKNKSFFSNFSLASFKGSKKAWWIIGSIITVFIGILILIAILSSPEKGLAISIPLPAPEKLADASSIQNYSYDQKSFLIASFSIEPEELEIKMSSSGIVDTMTGNYYAKNSIGDVNNDGVINIIDLGIVIEHYAENTNDYSKGDVNNDSVVNIIDIGIIIDNYIY